MGLFGGTQIETNKEEFYSAEYHSVDCSGESKVLTELQIAIRYRGYRFRRPKVKRIEKNSNDGSGCLFVRLYDIVNIHANADMALQTVALLIQSSY